MATIKDVAKQAGLSATTVSMVINGKAQKHNIPQSTIDKVRKVMDELNYTPSTAARRLRTVGKNRSMIAFYWPIDVRSDTLGLLLSELQNTIVNQHYNCEILMKPFAFGKIKEYAEDMTMGIYDGIVVGALSPEDLEYLESLEIEIPLVLINRRSSKYSSVCTSEKRIAEMAADMICRKGYRRAVVVQPPKSSIASSERAKSFIEACRSKNIEISEADILVCPNTRGSGYEAGLRYCTAEDMPEMIFTVHDLPAEGMLKALNENGKQAGKDYEMLVVATQTEEATEYLMPSVSIFSMAPDQQAKEAMKLLMEMISKREVTIQRVEIMPKVILRESFT